MNSNPITSQLLGKPKSDKTTTAGPLSVQLFGKPKDDKKKKTPPKIHNYESFSEPISELKDGLKKQISETAEKGVSETWKQLLGANKPRSPFSGNLQPGQELDIDAIKQQQEQASEKAKVHNIEPGINYVGEVLHGGEKAAREETQRTQAQIQELIGEIHRIGATVKEVNQQATEATQGAVQTQERYHKGFLQRVLSMFEDTRDRIEDSDNWLQASQGKKNLKGKIGAPAKQKAKAQQLTKKHGTKFSQSGERTAGTSSG